MWYTFRKLTGSPGLYLLPDDLDQNALPTAAIELSAKDLLPRAKDFELSRVVEPPAGDRHDDLAAHHLALQVGSFCPSLWVLKVYHKGRLSREFAYELTKK